MTQEIYALYADTYMVFQYVFQTRRYREIFGASALLDAINRVEATGMLAGRSDAVVVSAGGGELRALFATEAGAAAYGEDLVALYQERTAGAVQLAYGIMGRAAGEPLADTFLRAQFALRRQEVEADLIETRLPLLPMVKACESCGEQPAAVVARDGQHICRVCEQKRAFGRELARWFRGDEYGGGKRSRREIEAFEYLKKLKDEPFGSGLLDLYKTMVDSNRLDSMTYDTGALGDASREGSRVAFLYTDGNKMGQFFATLGGETPSGNDKEAMALPASLEATLSDQDQRYLQNLRNASNQVHERTVLSIQKTIEEFPKMPVQVAMAGGDDGVMMVPADQAVPFAVRYAEIFESEMQEMISAFTGSPHSAAAPTAAVGMVIARSSYPLHQLFTLGYDTMHEGKELSSKTGESVFSWTILGANDPPRIKRLTKKSIDASGIEDTYRLYGGPYSLAQMKELLDTAHEMHTMDFPRSKIKPFLRLLTLSPKVSQYHWRQWRLHLTEKQNQLITEFHSKWGDAEASESPWRACKDTPHKWRSPLGDLFQIYPYLGVKTGEKVRS